MKVTNIYLFKEGTPLHALSDTINAFLRVGTGHTFNFLNGIDKVKNSDGEDISLFQQNLNGIALTRKEEI